MARQAVDMSVIVHHNCHYNQNGWLKYDHRVMYKKYTTPCPHMGCGVVERHLEMAQPKKMKFTNIISINGCFMQRRLLLKLDKQPRSHLVVEVCIQ